MGRFFFFFFFFFTSVLCWADSSSDQCTRLTEEGERFFDNDEPEKAIQSWNSAVSFCEKSKSGDYSLFINLGQKYFLLQKYTEAVELFKKALVKFPGIQIAYLNICAAEMQREAFDAAIAACKKGIESKAEIPDGVRKNWIPKLYFNAGFAMFKKAVANNEFTDSSSKKYFDQAAKLDPSMGQAYYYSGMVTQNMMNNPTEARAIYEKGCLAKDSESCKLFQSLSKPSNQPKPMAPALPVKGMPAGHVPFSAKEQIVLQKIENAYLKKGLPAEQAKAAVDQLKNALSELTAEQRSPSLDSVLKAME